MVADLWTNYWVRCGFIKLNTELPRSRSVGLVFHVLRTVIRGENLGWYRMESLMVVMGLICWRKLLSGLLVVCQSTSKEIGVLAQLSSSHLGLASCDGLDVLFSSGP